MLNSSLRAPEREPVNHACQKAAYSQVWRTNDGEHQSFHSKSQQPIQIIIMLSLIFVMKTQIVIIDALNADKIKDALLVPVSINYERLCDGNFVYEQLGEKKEPENFSRAVSSIWKTLTSKYGQMRIDFNEPFSLRQLVSAFETSTNDSHDLSPKKFSNNVQAKRLRQQPSTSSLYGKGLVKVFSYCKMWVFVVAELNRISQFDRVCVHALLIVAIDLVLPCQCAVRQMY